MGGMVYEWGSRSFPVPPQVVGDQVQRIIRKDGRCTPAKLVAVAKNEKSPLHPLFTWDNDQAATNWRTHQARNIISSIVVTVQAGTEGTKAPAFISVGHTLKTQDAGEGYRAIEVVMDDPAFKHEALAEALSRFKALRRRYESIEALAPVWNVLDQIAA